ncbi:T9SS type A sorting domain-containing protein, partial [bacterium]|nr:T9SS type A sorting domain-containing protein [bacterium]
HTIIWDSGDLNSGTIGDGTTDESNDCALLEAWANDEGATPHNHKTNLLVMGDGVVSDLNSIGATTFLTDILGTGIEFLNYSYYDLTGGDANGGVINPLITSVTGSPFAGLDDFYAFGGCPLINQFDVLETNNSKAAYGLQYPDYNGDSYYTAICLDDTTANGSARRAVTTGFSFMAIRDNDPENALVRNEFLAKVWEFFENGINDTITDSDDPEIKYLTELHQNCPNPFNPSTTIKFNLKNKGHVSIQIYDVAGRLVNTLVNDVREAGRYTETWNGINNRGANVASGVYFYRMNAEDYSDTKKMILLR